MICSSGFYCIVLWVRTAHVAFLVLTWQSGMIVIKMIVIENNIEEGQWGVGSTVNQSIVTDRPPFCFKLATLYIGGDGRTRLLMSWGVLAK